MAIEKLEQLTRLREAGALSDAEFARAKAQLVNEYLSAQPPSPIAPEPVLAPTPPQGIDQMQLVSALVTAVHASSPSPSTATEPEYLIETFRSSTLGWLFGSFSGWTTIGVSVWSLIMAMTAPVGGGYFLIFALMMCVILYNYFYNLSSSYDLTNERLVLKTGIINKQIDEIELFRIKDSRVQFSLLNQLVGTGTIVVSSSDHSRVAPMRYISRAREIRETLRGLVASERQRKRVQEVDGWRM